MTGRAEHYSDSVCQWADASGAVSVRMERSALEAIRGEALSAFMAIPRRGMEIGGLLLGSITADSPVEVVIEGYEPIPCEHRFGPSFVLSDNDRDALTDQLERSRGAAIGLYRSYTGREPAFDAADLELARACSPPSGSLHLLLQPVSAGQCMASFAAGENGEVWPLGGQFRFSAAEMQALRGNLPEAASPAGEQRGPAAPEHEPAASESAPQDAPEAEAFEMPPPVKPRRLMGDTVEMPRKRRRWLPIAACVLVGAGLGVAYEWWNSRAEPERIAAVPVAPREAERQMPSPPAENTAPEPNQPAPESTPPSQPPSGAAESTAPAPETKAPEGPPAAANAPTEPVAPKPEPERGRRKASDGRAAVAKPPVPTRTVQPGISEGIRARIQGRVVVPVRVAVSRTGRVTSASAEPGSDGLYRYLAERAVQAARASSFQPARTRRGARVSGETTIYFTFTPSH